MCLLLQPCQERQVGEANYSPHSSDKKHFRRNRLPCTGIHLKSYIIKGGYLESQFELFRPPSSIHYSCSYRADLPTLLGNQYCWKAELAKLSKNSSIPLMISVLYVCAV